MRRVLVVDDDPEMLEMLSMALAEADMRPIAVQTGEAARSAFSHSGPFDAVLIDRTLETEDGRRLADDLVRHGQPSDRVVLMSGYHDQVAGYTSVAKPFRLHSLIETLRQKASPA